MSLRNWLSLLLDILVCTACAVVPAAALVALHGWWTGSPGTLRGLGIWAVIAVLVMQNGAITGYLLWRAGSHRRWLYTDGGTALDTTTVVYCVAAGPFVLCVNAIVGLIFAAFGLAHDQATTFPLTRGDRTGQLVFAVVAVVLVPIAEELLFRGYLYGRLRALVGRWGAVLLSTVVFAVAHGWSVRTGAWVLVAQTAVLGGVLGWVRLRSERLLPSIVAHIVNNAVAILLVLSCIDNPGRGCPST